jgi:TolB protein
MIVAESPAPESSVRYDSHRDRIFYTRYDDRLAMLVSEGRNLFEDPNGDVSPGWSPDGQFIAFDTVVDGQSVIAMLEIETGEITRLTERAGNDLAPSWSLDGRRLAFGGRPDSTGNWDIWTVDVETKVVERVTKHLDFDGGPVVVPASALRKE